MRHVVGTGCGAYIALHHAMKMEYATMAQGSIRQRNPFMLMLQPEAVLAAMERSEKLSRLARHSCHPLDKPTPVRVVDKRARALLLDDDELLDVLR